ncbi:MAG: pit accessory protein [Dokdonella sp.]|nr:pit accessory protein [Dokdonella sp.]MCB1572263.1 pit accessory protein [Xanthomonadales bacterium]MCB1576895.1 pit accessory protein [Xanthomonadales bacterium]
MFSLQTIFGKGDRFYGLLEASAEAARLSARALRSMLAEEAPVPALDQFRVARKREKDLFAQINLELVNTFVTALEREDIEALAGALYKIPKTVEKFAERHALFAERLVDIDYSPQAAMLERACDVIVSMVGELRGGIKLDVMHALNERMQSIESEADRLLLELYHHVFTDETDAARLMVRKDLFELLEKAIDRCRDAGNVIYHIALKNS